MAPLQGIPPSKSGLVDIPPGNVVLVRSEAKSEYQRFLYGISIGKNYDG